LSRADELAHSPAERACLDALRAASGETDGAMERHCVRQFLIAERLAEDLDAGVDRELLLCAGFLHDTGLYPSVKSHDAYVSDGRHLAERTLAPFDWEPQRLERCLRAVEQHHALRDRSSLGTEVELMRRADLVDVSAGLVAFGIDRWWIRGLVREVPRSGFHGFLAREIWRMARERPGSLPRIFVPHTHG
jgi:HD domain-containing protein